MKPHCLIAGLAVLLSPAAAIPAASPGLRLETVLYVFRANEFHAVTIPGAAATVSEDRGRVFRSPATIRFDQETLSLEGPTFAWAGGLNPPHGFSLIATPAVSLSAGTPVTILSTAPTQYLEKLPDGTLQVRDIPADSPDAPHCRLTFTLGPADDTAGDFPLACDLEIATVSARENVAGVALEVGKPVLARFNEKLTPTMRTGEWSALFLQAPNGSDYSMLVLLKVGPAGPAGPPAKLLTKVGEYHLRTARYGAAAVAQGDYVYVIGGQNRGGILGDMERFDVRTHEVTQLTDQLTPRHHQGAVLVDGKIYIFGGRGYGLPGSSGIDETLEIYDIASGKIAQGAAMPWPHAYFGAAALDGKIYAIGGTMGARISDVRQTNRTDVYDIAGNSWSQGSPMPTERETRTAVVWRDAIIVAGGYHVPDKSSGLKAVECFIPAKQQWLSLPDLGRPVGANSAAVLGNHLFLFGNYDPADEILAYDLTTHQSTVIEDELAPASQSTAVALNGLIYVIGGNGGAGRVRHERDATDAIQVFAPAPGTVAGPEPAGRLMTAAELDIFTASYYLHPRPELVAGAIEALGPSGVEKDDGRVFVGFFAELFAANPGRTAEWWRLIGRQDLPTQNRLQYALDLSRPGAILALTDLSVELNDIYWGAFFASGNPAYLRKLADELRFVDERRDRKLFSIGATAMWSLAHNAPQHPLVRATLEAVRTEADPRTRELIDELLRNDLSAIRDKIGDVHPESRQKNPESRQIGSERGHLGIGPDILPHDMTP